MRTVSGCASEKKSWRPVVFKNDGTICFPANWSDGGAGIILEGRLLFRREGWGVIMGNSECVIEHIPTHDHV